MAWMQSQMEFPWTVVTGEGATLLHEGPWRLPPPACLGPWCAEQGRPGVDMRRLRSPEDSSLSSFCVPGTSPVTSTAPTLGVPETNGRAQRGSVWGTGCPANEVHRGLAGCTPDRGFPPWTRLCLSTRVPCRTLKAPVNTEEGLTLRITGLSVRVCPDLGLQDQKTVPGLHECSA